MNTPLRTACDLGQSSFADTPQTAHDLPQVITFARLFAASPDGTFPHARILAPRAFRPLPAFRGKRRTRAPIRRNSA
jgi:hypothetical protein